jgi:hypothetical protein
VLAAAEAGVLTLPEDDRPSALTVTLIGTSSAERRNPSQRSF